MSLKTTRITSTSSNPFFNNALEDFLMKLVIKTPQRIALFYVNDECVVLGKNQCVYKEVNFNYLAKGGTLARRLSGGGTVYHDKGNLNVSLITPFEDSLINNYLPLLQPIVSTLTEAGVEAAINGRNDIVCREKKVSGCAQFTDRKAVLSHCTLLCNSQLNLLSAALKQNEIEILTNAVSSVRSAVMNVAEVSSTLADPYTLINSLAAAFDADDVLCISEDDIYMISILAEDFRSKKWIWGRSPDTTIKFTAQGEQHELLIINGILHSTSFNGLNDFVDLWFDEQAIAHFLNLRGDYNPL